MPLKSTESKINKLCVIIIHKKDLKPVQNEKLISEH